MPAAKARPLLLPLWFRQRHFKYLPQLQLCSSRFGKRRTGKTAERRDPPTMTIYFIADPKGELREMDIPRDRQNIADLQGKIQEVIPDNWRSIADFDSHARNRKTTKIEEALRGRE